jgi:hypothetical protein
VISEAHDSSLISSDTIVQLYCVPRIFLESLIAKDFSVSIKKYDNRQRRQ